MTIDTQKLRELVTFDFELPVSVRSAVDDACNHIDAQAVEIARLLGACRTAVLALAHATQENRGVYGSAYQAVSDAIEETRHDR